MNRFILPKILVSISVISIFSWFYNTYHRITEDREFPGKSYDKPWKQVDSLQALGLYKQALSVSDSIYYLAKKDNNSPQILKTLIFRLKFTSYTEEEGFSTFLNKIDQEYGEAGPALKSMLLSVKAELLWSYYESNRWIISERTPAGITDEDYLTWDASRFMDTCRVLYLKSIQNEAFLKSVEIEKIKDVLIENPADRKLRPTLYDFLAHRALDFFMNEETNLNKPVYAFELDDPEYFADSERFQKKQIITRDSLSHSYETIRLFQQLISYHKKSNNLPALIDVDLKRLEYVKSVYKGTDKKTLHLEALNALNEKYKGKPESAPILFALAQHYKALGNDFKVGYDDQIEKQYLKKAVNIASEITENEKYKKKYRDNAAYLIKEITKPQIEITTEQVIIPQKPALFRLGFKNTDKVFFKLINVNFNEYQKYQLLGEESFKSWLVTNGPITTWNIAIPNDGLYHFHNTELELPALNNGFYILLSNTSNSFESNDYFIYNTFFVSNIAYTNRSQYGKGLIELRVMDRTTGHALHGVTVKLFSDEYDYTIRRSKKVLVTTLKTDEWGMVSYAVQGNNYKNYSYSFAYKNDFLTGDERIGVYRYDIKDKESDKTLFFTDRGIYRPGQRVYFKAIKIKSNSEKNALLINSSSQVIFRDPSYKEISTLKLITNEYGSFQGFFDIPLGLATGTYTISDLYGQKTIQVEEYKRPKFEVTIEKPNTVFRVNDTVKVTGNAKALAGFNITNAKVGFRVYRTSSLPVWYRRWYHDFSDDEQEITYGTTQTDEAGNFTVSFKAIPNRSIPETGDPVFNYRISVDVTDETGETRTAEQAISTGYKTINLSIFLPEFINRKEPKPITISVFNLNGIKQYTPVQVKVEKLKKDIPLYRSKSWKYPDVWVIEEKEYKKKFPDDAYKQQGILSDQQVESTIFEGYYVPNDTIPFSMEFLKRATSGNYRITVSAKDIFDKTANSYALFTLFDKEEKQSPIKTFLSVQPLQNKVEPGEIAQFYITSSQSIQMLYEIEHKGKIVKKELIKLNNIQQIISIPVTEEYRGNFTVHFHAVLNNRFYHFSHNVTVPFTNKELKLTLQSWKDKMLPGSNETWTLNISSVLNTKQTAEVLLGMYDASLDAFVANDWYMNLWTSRYGTLHWTSPISNVRNGTKMNYVYEYYDYIYPVYAYLNWFGYNIHSAGYLYGGFAETDYENYDGDAQTITKTVSRGEAIKGNLKGDKLAVSEEQNKADESEKSGEAKEKYRSTDSRNEQVVPRSNFNETAFFYPQLITDEKGNISFSFTIPESLTRWKFMGLAHTKDLKTGTTSKEVVTQKELMINTFAPRFFREGDVLYFTAKVTNLSSAEQNGFSELNVYNTQTNKSLTDKIIQDKPTKPFTVKPGQSVQVEWKMKIPEDAGLIRYTVKAQSGEFSDGEENVIPVLTNRVLVTESVPLWVNGQETRKFTLDKLNTVSATRKNVALTLEFTSNPVWYAIQSLPYLMEYPYECAEQTFNRLFANSIASHIANSDPQIKKVFEIWKNTQPEALQSKLNQNQELKNILIEETPWLRNAQNEEERKHRLGVLFDLNKMKQEKFTAERKLFAMQTPNGGFPWFSGGPDDRYITQLIVGGFGKMKWLKIQELSPERYSDISRAIIYLDKRIEEDFNRLIKEKIDLTKDNLGYTQTQYLYVRSFFKEVPVHESAKTAFEYYLLQAEKFGIRKDDYSSALLSISLHRFSKQVAAKQIVASLKDRSIYNEELGMYWKGMLQGGYYWYNAPIEMMAVCIEAFDEVGYDQESVSKMQRWLLKNKQTNDWKTTRATADAIYALLLRGNTFLNIDNSTDIRFGSISADIILPEKTEAGTGYFKKVFSGEQIKPEMGTVHVTKKTAGPGWGAMYWQYLEDMDKVTKPAGANPLQLSKKLFIEKKTDKGLVLEEVNNQTQLNIGDRVISRIIFTSDRPMEYVHLKDMRASSLEPENVLSSYKWQQGLGYYESTRDVATHFFISYVPRGTFVFEYPSRVTHKGIYSNGISQIQCMYAPEFNYHTKGESLKIAQ
ncbi:MAG: MG2 domain-containing protein [Flavobacteriales bacterium]|nr:MG2 domain-containing protein [Flavobacteriales bacterium]